MKRVILFLVIASAMPERATSQIQKRGEGLARIVQQYTSSDSFFDSDLKAGPIRTNSIYMTNLYAEYGFTDRFTASVLLPVFVRTTVNSLQYNQTGNTESGSSLNSFGDSEINFKYAIRNKMPVEIVGYVALGLPFGKKGTIGSETDLHTGDGEFNQLIGIQARQAFSAFHILGYVGYNNRTKEFSNDIRYGFEAGYRHEKFRVSVKFTAIESLFNDTAPVTLNGIFSNHKEMFAPGTELVYHVTKAIGIVASADFIVAGRNTLNAPMFGLGVQLLKR
jgi:protein XagA